MDYPKSVTANLLWRRKLLLKAAQDLEFRAKLARLYHEDILFAFNAFYYTLDVRKRPNHNIPFCTYAYQDQAILTIQQHIREGRDLLIEKSRDMGATWMILACIFHAWHSPEGGGDFLLGSRKEDYVDKKGDMRTHFAKVRYLYKRLPVWLRPAGFNLRAHDTFMKFQNPVTGSSITGESNNPNFSTQGRYAAIMYDEFAKWENSDIAAWTAGGDATPCRIALSTPFGAGGQYYSLAISKKLKVLRLHWSLHPEKALGLSCIWPPPNEETKKELGVRWKPRVTLTSPWYESECKRRTVREVRQELDINYLGSGDPVFDGRAWDNLMLYHELEDRPKALGRLRVEDFGISWVSEDGGFDPEGILMVYKPYDPRSYYCAGVDVVEGVENGDYATIVIYNRVAKDVDAFYYSRIDELGLAKVIKIIDRLYGGAGFEDSVYANHQARATDGLPAGATSSGRGGPTHAGVYSSSGENGSVDAEGLQAGASRALTESPGEEKGPWWGIETTGPGLSTFDKVQELDINNLFMAPRYDVVKGGVSYKKGWRTDTNSRNELVSGIREWLNDGAGKLNSGRLCGELMTFVRSKTGKPQAKSGCHDDAVMAFGIAVQVDQIVPLDEEEVRMAVAQMRDFVQTPLEDVKLDEIPKSQEDYCMDTVLQRIASKVDETFFDMY